MMIKIGGYSNIYTRNVSYLGIYNAAIFCPHLRSHHVNNIQDNREILR